MVNTEWCLGISFSISLDVSPLRITYLASDMRMIDSMCRTAMGMPPQVILSRRISAYLEKREEEKKRGRVRREGNEWKENVQLCTHIH